MSKEPILVVLAAGMGSRYGGPKQIDPLGPYGEIIIDYSLFDARRAGFKRVAFIIRRDMEADFMEAIGNRAKQYFDETIIVHQDQTMIVPKDFEIPAGRIKPWGTAHALLCCEGKVDAPMAIINADDYYGPASYKLVYDFLIKVDPSQRHYAMVSFPVSNTLSDSGSVARGVCEVENGKLKSIVERTHVVKRSRGAFYSLDNGEYYFGISDESTVSMNFWGLTPAIYEDAYALFNAFINDEVPNNPLKSEIFLPNVIGQLIKSGRADVDALRTPDRWYGVTYKEDKPTVQQALREMTANGLYPTPLWGNK